MYSPQARRAITALAMTTEARSNEWNIVGTCFTKHYLNITKYRNIFVQICPNQMVKDKTKEDLQDHHIPQKTLRWVLRQTNIETCNALQI